MFMVKTFIISNMPYSIYAYNHSRVSKFKIFRIYYFKLENKYIST